MASSENTPAVTTPTATTDPVVDTANLAACSGYQALYPKLQNDLDETLKPINVTVLKVIFKTWADQFASSMQSAQLPVSKFRDAAVAGSKAAVAKVESQQGSPKIDVLPEVTAVVMATVGLQDACSRLDTSDTLIYNALSFTGG